MGLFLISALSLAATLALPSLVTPADAYNPDTVGVLQPNAYQVDQSERLLLFFVALGVIAAFGGVFLIIIFSCDWLEKRRMTRSDTSKCIAHILSFEGKQHGMVKRDETVFDFHYYPSDTRPDHVITNEMQSVDDAFISHKRNNTMQRRQMENASRSIVQSTRSQMRLSTAALRTVLPSPTSASAGLLSKDAADKGTRPGTPMVAVGLGGLTSSGGISSVAPGGGSSIAAPATTLVGRGFYDDLDDDPDYFGFDDDLDFALGS